MENDMLTGTTEEQAIKLASLYGREWPEMGEYERELYRDEVRRIADAEQHA